MVVETFQEYCLVCGARLNETGSAGLAERWRHAVPLADKDWGWPVLIALAIAVLASVFAILAVQSDRTKTIKALGPSVTQTTAAATTGTSQTTTGSKTTNSSSTTTKTTSTGKTTTSPIRTGGGLITWPGPSAYTIVLASLPISGGKAIARQKALQALHSGLVEDVGVLASSDFSSLHPGYYVVFSGVYRSQSEAQKHLSAAHRAGFDRPYPKRVAS